MKTERGLPVDAREARGLNDGSISVLVRVIPDLYPPSHVTEIRPHELDNGEYGFWAEDGPEFLSPFGSPDTRLRAVCHHGDPCKHRGCNSHVTHVCEGCGRGPAGTTLLTKSVRVCQVQEVTEEEAFAFGVHQDRSYWLGGIHPVKGSLQCWNTHTEAVLAFVEPDSDKRGRGANPYVFVGTVEKV